MSFAVPIVGNGRDTSFWDTPWCKDTVLKVLAPRIYALEMRKDISAESKLSQEGLEFSLRRTPRGGREHVQLEKLIDCLEGCSLRDLNDRWSWSLNGSGNFSVASVRKVIDDNTLPKSMSKTRWVKVVPIKVNVHAWKVQTDGLPTRFNLSRRGMEIESIVCPLCEKMVESTRHLFFSCCLVTELMRLISRWWDMEYKEVNSYLDWPEWLVSIRLPVNQKQAFEVEFKHHPVIKDSSFKEKSIICKRLGESKASSSPLGSRSRLK
nr:hypothetical protein [Tanacetum cinerariifolium]